MTTKTGQVVPLLARLSVPLPDQRQQSSVTDPENARAKPTRVTEVRRETTDDF